jgi:FkbM family methyltransferase
VTFSDRYARASLRWRCWMLGKHPGLLWRARLAPSVPEPELALLGVLCRGDATMVDVGAAFGMWAYHRYAGAVVAFEPLPHLASALARGFRGRVEVHQVALSAESGTARLTMPERHWGYSTIEPENDLRGKVSESLGFASFDVDKRTLDSYELRDVAFVKVDAEGHEPSVLAGARATIARDLPALVVETEERHNVGSVDAVSAFAAELGYRRYFLLGGQLRDGFTLEQHQHPDRPDDYVRNLIFLQNEHVAKLRAAPKLPFTLAG